jgi:gluconokinase
MIAVLMGVSGCGKTTVGKILSRITGWRMFDADDFHSAENIEKMRSGVPLTDEDRWPWLDNLNTLLREWGENENVLLACSALKQSYRDRLARGCRDVRWILLSGDFDLILSRLANRRGHYMPASLLRSQFETLEEPADAIVIDIADQPEVIARRIAEVLGAPQPR